jgi:hypothetical protein
MKWYVRLPFTIDGGKLRSIDQETILGDNTCDNAIYRKAQDDYVTMDRRNTPRGIEKLTGLFSY